MYYIDFFSNLGFDFNADLEPKVLTIGKKLQSIEELKISTFYYKCKKNNNTNTSFYLITTTLTSKELTEVRRYIWNKNDADLIFYYPHEDALLDMYYAKYSPKVNNGDSLLYSFATKQKDLDIIEDIKRWKFDSGVFWLKYHSFIKKAKYKGIDKELVSTLNTLKEKLHDSLLNLVSDGEKRNEIVQALIDRTLYIKYLEDNHIINSYFYQHYFKDKSLSYKRLLEHGSAKPINELFKIIHQIFNNALFDQPTIDDHYLTGGVCNLIAKSFNGSLIHGQLSLFDFQFNILPVEFISYIYEIFLSKEQKGNGIYYTPKKLAQLIVDEVINEDKIGPILDPSCGSGMFLIVGYQRLLEIAQKQKLEEGNNLDKIKFRIQLLSDNIFGIEKQVTAQRFTLFSLSLQIFSGIDSDDIEAFISKELQDNKKIDLFSQHSFFGNIKRENTLNISEAPFEGKQFSYIVGNPPFFEIPSTEEYNHEINFLNSYEVDLPNLKNVLAKQLVGKHQISQCFFIKIKDWSDESTRFGFVSNSSNFDNDNSKEFQGYFYSNYRIEKIYELSRVKKILFEKAQESVLAIIFNNENTNKTIEYYPVELGLFSEKPFELLILQEDNMIEIEQEKLITQEVKLRDYLVGNEYDRILVSKIGANSKLEEYSYDIHRGFEIWGEDAREKEFNISEIAWKSLDSNQKEHYLNIFINKYFSTNYSDDFDKPYIKPANLQPFRKLISNQYINSIENFHRPRKDRDIYLGKKLIFTRIGSKLNCVYSQEDDYFDFSIYTFKLKEDNMYYLFQALLNSQLIQFYLDLYHRKRVFDSFPRIGNGDILKIPIPTDLDEDLVNQISEISKNLSESKYKYSEVETKLNELIFDLYELSYWEKQRIRDYFFPKSRIVRTGNILDDYKSVLKSVLGFYSKNQIDIETTSTSFNLIVVKISLNINNSDAPKAIKTKMYILNEIFDQNPNSSFLACQEKIYGKDYLYIIKEDYNTNWTKTKAFEDAQDILKHLMIYDNGERIY